MNALACRTCPLRPSKLAFRAFPQKRAPTAPVRFYNGRMGKRPDITERTRAEIQEAFWQLYAARPLESITVQEVCARAGYTRGTFYLHFRDRYDVLDSIEEQVLADMERIVESCMQRLARNRSKATCLVALGEVVAYYEKNKSYIVVLLGSRGDPSFVVRLKDRLKPLWRLYVVGDAHDRSEQEIDLLLEYTLSGSLFMLSRWLQNPGDVSAAQIGHLVYDAAIKDIESRLN